MKALKIILAVGLVASAVMAQRGTFDTPQTTPREAVTEFDVSDFFMRGRPEGGFIYTIAVDGVESAGLPTSIEVTGAELFAAGAINNERALHTRLAAIYKAKVQR